MVRNANAPQRESRVGYSVFEVKGKWEFAISRSATCHKAIFATRRRRRKRDLGALFSDCKTVKI